VLVLLAIFMLAIPVTVILLRLWAGQVFHSSGLLVYIPTAFTLVIRTGSPPMATPAHIPIMVLLFLGLLRLEVIMVPPLNSLTWVNPPAVFNFFRHLPSQLFAITAMAAYPPLVFYSLRDDQDWRDHQRFCSLACAVNVTGGAVDPAAPGMAFRRCW